MSDWYLLDEQHNVIGPVADWLDAARQLEGPMRRVALTQVTSECRVSTVFMGLDHRFGDGPPLVFESMVFGGPFDQEQDRYATWDEALAGHARLVEKCQPILTEDVGGA